MYYNIIVMEKEIDVMDKLIDKKNHLTLVYFLVRIFIVIMIFILLGLYFILPISSCDIMNISGNIFLKRDDIYNLLEINKDDSLFSLNDKIMNEKLSRYDFIKNYNISLTPISFKIQLEEIPLSYISNDKFYNIENKEIDLDLYSDLSYDYYKNSSIYLPTLLESTNIIDEKSLTNYLKIIPYVNLYNKEIFYIEYGSENSFYFYYKVNSNNDYIRVKFKYNNDFSLYDYTNNLNIDTINLFMSKMDDDFISKNTQVMKIDNVDANCLTTYVYLERNNGKIIAYMNGEK